MIVTSAPRQRLLPGGVSRDQLYTDPLFVASKGRGARLIDDSGKSHLDLVNNYTSLIHGHAHPPTLSALVSQAQKGTAYGAPNELEVELASTLLDRLPSADQVRFVNSGTEATMLALQLARVVTGRTRIGKFEGGYHGSHEFTRVSVKPVDGGDPLHPEPEPEVGSTGFDLTDVLPYHDVDAAVEIAKAKGSTWAALIVEPLQGSAGMLPSPAGLLDRMRQVADETGFLLVVDEVMTFRLGGVGLQTTLGVAADLTTLAKIVGGGLPAGAVVGRRDIMEHLAPPRADRIAHAGTFNGNPLTMAAGIATLKDYPRSRAAALDARGDSLRESLDRKLRPMGFSMSGQGSLMNVHGCENPPRCWRDVRSSRRDLIALLHMRLRDDGFLIAPRGMICLSTAMSEADLDALDAAVVAGVKAITA